MKVKLSLLESKISLHERENISAWTWKHLYTKAEISFWMKISVRSVNEFVPMIKWMDCHIMSVLRLLVTTRLLSVYRVDVRVRSVDGWYTVYEWLTRAVYWCNCCSCCLIKVALLILTDCTNIWNRGFLHVMFVVIAHKHMAHIKKAHAMCALTCIWICVLSFSLVACVCSYMDMNTCSLIPACSMCAFTLACNKLAHVFEIDVSV